MTHDGVVQLGCVGIGQWGRRLLRCFTEIDHCQVKVCCDIDPGQLQRMDHLYPGIQTTTTYRDLLTDEQLDAVVLTVPTSLHYAITKQALIAGKHTFVEKPLALTSEEAEELVSLARTQGKVLMVGHLLRYHPAIQYLKKILDEGTLGEIYYIYSARLNLGQVRRDENALWSLAPHDVSMLLYLLGQMPKEVMAVGAPYLQTHIEDVVFITLRFPKGVLAHIHVSWLDPHKIRQLTVVGSQRMVTFDDTEPTEKLRIYDRGAVRDADPGGDWWISLRSGAIQIPHIDLTEPLRLECQQFLDSIREGKRPPSDGEDGLKVIRVLNAAQRSLEQGGRWIALS